MKLSDDLRYEAAMAWSDDYRDRGQAAIANLIAKYADMGEFGLAEAAIYSARLAESG
jgi:hypothetical protein